MWQSEVLKRIANIQAELAALMHALANAPVGVGAPVGGPFPAAPAPVVAVTPQIAPQEALIPPAAPAAPVAPAFVAAPQVVVAPVAPPVAAAAATAPRAAVSAPEPAVASEPAPAVVAAEAVIAAEPEPAAVDIDPQLLDGFDDGSGEEEEDDGTGQRRKRWRYVAGTWYRVVGANPFRNGNNYNLFEYLTRRYADQPFSREQLGEGIDSLTRSGKFSSQQSEEQSVIVFLRTAGIEKERIVICDPPASVPAPAPAPAAAPVAPLLAAPVPPLAAPAPLAHVAAQDDSSADAGETTYTLLGENPFRSGVNLYIWERIGNKPFLRAKLQGVVDALVLENLFESKRPPETIVRDFLGRVQEKGKLRRS